MRGIELLLVTCLCACGRVGFGSLDDGATSAEDPDGDGFVDTVDNCPTIANVDQDNEDGDRFGDACDPCPPISDGSPIVDSDGDGVSDACDPFPTVGGDAIALFEGFSHGAPSNAVLKGPWSFANGEATIVGAFNELDAILWNTPVAGAVTVGGSATIDAIFGPNNARGAGAVAQSDPTLSVGIACVLAILTSNAQAFAMTDNATLNVLGATAATTAAGVTFRFRQTRRASSYTCDTTVVATPLTGSLLATPSPAYLGIRARSMSARFAWAMIVTSP